MPKRQPVARVTNARNNRRMKKAAEPASLAERVRASEARKIEAGGRRMPGGVMPADAAEALDTLLRNGYSGSASGCIFRAVIEAAERLEIVGSKAKK